MPRISEPMTISLQPSHARALRELSLERADGNRSAAIAYLLETHPETCHKLQGEVAARDNV